MNILELIALLRRQWLVFVVIVTATLLAAGTLQQLQSPTAKVTQLYSVALQSVPTTNSFDVTRVNDDFARTVAGWLQSPSFDAKISERAGVPVDISGAAQAKQNLLIDLTFADLANAETAANAASEVLQQEVGAYNASSEYKFALGKRAQDATMSKRGLPETLVAALLGGVLLSIGWVLLVSYLGGRVSNSREAEELLGVTAKATFCTKEHGFVENLIKEHAVIVAADCDLKKLDIEKENIRVPEQADKLASKDAPLVIVRLDRTRASTLRQLRANCGGKITLAIWG